MELLAARHRLGDLWRHGGRDDDDLAAGMAGEAGQRRQGLSAGRRDRHTRYRRQSAAPGRAGTYLRHADDELPLSRRQASSTTRPGADDLYTLGDVGYLDEDGYLFITDRLKDMIISGGANIYPAEVEAVLFNHPAVGDVSVIGVPDPHWGEKVKAIVEPRAETSEAGDHRLLPRPVWRITNARRRSISSTGCRAIPTARCASASCASPIGPMPDGRSDHGHRRPKL